MTSHPCIARRASACSCRRAVALLAVVVLPCWLAACAGAKKPLSAQAQWVTHIDKVIEELQTQLGHCDRRGIASLLAPPLADDEAFTRGLADLCERTSSIHPAFVVERLWLKNADTVRADLQWTLRADLASPAGAASPTEGRQTAKSTMVMGTAHFTLVGKDSPRLTAVDGDNPFTTQFDQPLIP
jgi:hypothetical protein